MRSRSRTVILDAAFRLVGRDGLRALTYESLATETGLTKGGLLYHFPSREDLIAAMHARLEQRWDADLAGYVDGDPAHATSAQRLAAYVRSTATTPTRAELLLLLESADVPDLVGAWGRVLAAWAPPVPDADDAPGVDAFLARLAADGLWMFEALTDEPLPDDVRERAVERIIAMGVRPSED